MCRTCEDREKARKKYVWKKLYEARATIKAIREEVSTWDEDKFHWWYVDKIEEIINLKRKEVT